jgi:uncharacterized protein (DUF3820 family)
MMQMSEQIPLMPIGKYKGRPVTDIIVSDPGYVDWFKKQPDFEKKYNATFNIFMTQQLPGSSKTPQHNALQNKFLDNDVRNKVIEKKLPNTLNKLRTFKEYLRKIEKLFDEPEFVSYCGKHCLNEHAKNLLSRKYIDSKVELEAKFNWDVVIKTPLIYLKDIVLPCSKNMKNECLLLLTDINSNKYCLNETTKRIYNGYHYIDDGYEYHLIFDGFRVEEAHIHLELKPTLGDDYPEVLRKMKTQIQLTINDYKTKKYEKEDPDYRKYNTVSNVDGPTNYHYAIVIGNFESRTTSEEQLIEIFGQTGIKVLFSRDLFPDKLTYTNDELKSIENTSKTTELESEIVLLRQQLVEANNKIVLLESEISSLKKPEQNQKGKITNFFTPAKV